MIAKRTIDSCRGFTLIEIIAILVIISILAIVAATAASSSNAGVVAEANKLKTRLRYTQGKAMSEQSADWRMVVALNTYSLQRNGINVSFPDGDLSPYTLSNTSVAAGMGAYRFDDRGRPIDLAPSPNLITTDQTITLSGSPAMNIVVTRETGFIP